MKKFILLGLLSVFWTISGFANSPTYFPIALSPESLSNIHSGYIGGQWTTGVRLEIEGRKERGWLEKLMGDWSAIDHTYSVGYLTENFKNSVTYASVGGMLTALNSGGIGIRQIVYFNTGLPHGEKLKGELTYFVFYQMKNRSIFLSGGKEYLSFYLGFKSHHFDFQNEDVATYIDKAISLKDKSKRLVGGFYYNWDVGTPLSVGAEVNGTGGALLSLFIGI